MLKKTLTIIPLIFIMGCDIDLTHSRTFKWATADKNKIQNAVKEDYKNINPYPKEINENIEEASRERHLAKAQVSQLETTAKSQCKTSVGDTQTKQPNTLNKVDVNALYPQPGMGPDWAYDQKMLNNPVYQECINNITKDPLISDLKEKVKKLDEMYDARRKHDDEVKKITDKAIDEAIKKYAEKNGFELVITNQSASSGSNILYNKDKVVLDVTADVIDQLENSIAVKK